MANKFQRMLFSISVVAPVLIVTAVIEIIKNGLSLFSIMICIVGIVFSLYDWGLVSICKKRLEVINISVDSVTPNDSWCIAYIVTYMIPCISLVLEPLNWFITGGTALLIGVVIAVTNAVPPNPLLRAMGYHFYKVSSIDGATDYNLISKRSGIHNKNTIEKVNMIFDYVLFERS